MTGPDAGKPGFVLFGGKGFYSTYGFTSAKNNPSIIGYLPDGKTPHTINNDLNEDYPIHVPSPEIEKISVTIQKELYRQAEIEWVCFSKRQLEYMTPYFLVPGISCIMEWGWNHYNPASLVDLTNIGDLQDKFNNPYPLYTKNILQSNGNYDVIFGIITNFEWTVDGNKFRCKTEITSKDRIYSGLIVSATAEDKSADTDVQETNTNQFDSLIEFFDKSLDQFRNVWKTPPDSIPQLADFSKYVRAVHPKNADEYLYGVFYGREMQDMSNKYQNRPNKSYDFDNQTQNSELWLNLGLVIEAINFHASPLKAMKGKEMLHVDVDDVVVNAHPNMISSDGSICLIPNWKSPHYFYGVWGPQDKGIPEKLNPSDSAVPVPSGLANAIAKNKAPDWKLQNVCSRDHIARRDDIDEIINAIRYNKGLSSRTFEFPFSAPQSTLENKPYPANYSGYLKDIYINTSYLKGLLDNSSDIQTYFQLVEKLMEDVNGACGSFWDLRLVSALGDTKIGPSDPAPMKVIDYKFMYFSNRGNVWTFDYYDADSLLLGIGFKPTLSNAQAIRTIYAQTNNPTGAKTTVTNGTNELLDYQFTDRLKLADNVGDAPTPTADTSGFKDTMRELQQLDSPQNSSYQITTASSIYRLALPANDIQLLLLDDTDEDNNPKYTGIMPGIQATFTIQGIGGLRTFMMFLVRNLPEPYSEDNIVFRIVNIEETIEAGNWTTTITAGVIPLRPQIKARLGIT